MIRLPFTLSSYIGRQFFFSILIVLLGLGGVGMLIDTIELIRRASGKEYVPFFAVLQMGFLKFPALAEKLLPFAVLAGSMLALTRLTRSHELVVARAAGVSVWQFLLPALLVVLMIGTVTITVFNPFSAVLLLRYEQLESKYLTNKSSLLSVSATGLWLRQIEENNPHVSEHIIHASRISQSDMSFSDVIIFTFNKKGAFTERLDAEHASLEGDNLHLREVTRSLPGRPPEFKSEIFLPTTLELSYIQDSFASPETMPFWSLPSFINMLEKAGFSALRHRLYFQSLLASPILLAGMVLVAAVFSLRLPRRGKVGILIVAGVITGFLLHFFTDIIHALGSAGTLPVELAAWMPALLMIITGTATLLHFEDG